MRAYIQEMEHKGLTMWTVRVYTNRGNQVRERFTFKTRESATMWIEEFARAFPKSSVHYTVS
jgi:hypothetical protein